MRDAITIANTNKTGLNSARIIDIANNANTNPLITAIIANINDTIKSIPVLARNAEI
jgi:hypothetical protein